MKKLNSLSIVLSVVSVIICLLQGGNHMFPGLYLLPLLFCFLTILFLNVYTLLQYSIVFNLFLIQGLVRYCLLPVVLSSDGYLTILSYTNSGGIAIFYMILELVASFLTLRYVSNKQYKDYINRKQFIIPIKSYAFVSFILFLMFIALLQSGFLENVNFVWNFGDYVNRYVVEQEESQRGGLIGLLFTPFKIILFLLLFSIVYSSKHIKTSYKKYLYLFIVILASLFIVGTSRLSIIRFVLPLLIIIIYVLDSKSRKVLLYGFVAIIIPILLIASIAKFTRGDNVVTSESFFTASSINAYFSGPANISLGIDLYERNQNNFHLRHLISDTFQNAPFLSKFTENEYKTNLIFNREIYGHSRVADQIVPLSVFGLFHFGYMGAFLYVPYFLIIALYMERMSYRVDFIGYKYVFSYLSISLSMVFMLGVGSLYFEVFTVFLFAYLPLLIIYRLQNFKV